MEDEMWFCRICTYHNEGSSRICSMCDYSRPRSHHPYAWSTSSAEETDVYAANTYEESAESRSPWRFAVCSIPRLVLGALAWAIVGMLATVGIISGAIIGAFRGQAGDSGLLHGAGLGAVVGTLLTFEFLEILWACWNSEQRASRTSMVNIDDMTYEELYEMFGASGGTKGASKSQ